MSSEDIHRAEHTEDQQHTRENGHDDELCVNRFLVAFIWKNHKDKKINTLKKNYVTLWWTSSQLDNMQIKWPLASVLANFSRRTRVSKRRFRTFQRVGR